MKKIIKYIILPTVLLWSCEKSLDTKPKSFITDKNFFNNKTELDLAINGVYDPLFSGQPYQTGYNEYFRHAFLGTDESTSNQRVLNNDYPTHYNENSASSYVEGWWSTLYSGINRANLFLENIDKSQIISQQERDLYKGEAKFLRAHYFFLATQWFGDVPLRTNSTESLADAQISFTKSKDVYDFVIQEMIEAQDLLKSRPADAIPYNDKITQTTVQGILARVCLFAAGEPVNDLSRYEDASYWAQQVIKSDKHRLDPDYQQVFINHSSQIYDNINRETMWQLTPITGLSGATLREHTVARLGISSSNTNGIWGRVAGYERTNPRAYYTYEEGDLRRDWNIAPYYLGSGVVAGTQLAPIVYWPANASKWNREPGKWRKYYEPITGFTDLLSTQAIPMLRYADVLLMFAEAENIVNGPTSIGEIAGITPVEAINLVRRRGFGETKGSRGLGGVTLLTPGSGYRTAPTITFVGGTRNLRTQTISGRTYETENPQAIGNLSTSVSGTIASIKLLFTGDAYITLPTIIVGVPWQPNTAYVLNSQVVNAGNLYTVTKAGTSGSVPPTHFSGPFDSGTATFTYAGIAATAVAYFPPAADLQPAAYVDKLTFLKAIQDERLRELAFENWRRQDLKRWGILIPTVRKIAQEVASGSEELNPDGTKWFGPYVAPRTTSPYNANVNVFSTGPNNISSKNIYLPIPNSEILYNKLAKQNPGF